VFLAKVWSIYLVKVGIWNVLVRRYLELSQVGLILLVSLWKVEKHVILDRVMAKSMWVEENYSD